MKLGICYMVFDGEELLEFAARSIRSEVDHISATYQTTSYWGESAGPDLVPTMERLKKEGLLDEIIFYEPNLTIKPKEHEERLRNIGLEASKKAGCTHHISSDVDELCKPNELAYAKKVMDEGDYDFCMAPYVVYYKEPTWLIHPRQNLSITLVHKIDKHYDRKLTRNEFPFGIEPTRMLKGCKTWKEFALDEITVHHMSFVRKDVRKKMKNNDNKNFYNVRRLCGHHDNYKLGDTVFLLPDWRNRKTIEVENHFGIKF